MSILFFKTKEQEKCQRQQKGQEKDEQTQKMLFLLSLPGDCVPCSPGTHYHSCCDAIAKEPKRDKAERASDFSIAESQLTISYMQLTLPCIAYSSCVELNQTCCRDAGKTPDPGFNEGYVALIRR